MPHLRFLSLGSNGIGCAGVKDLADACAKGALPRLEVISLHCNQIGDAGFKDLASALAQGALPNLKQFSLSFGFGVSPASKQAFKDAMKKRGVSW